PLLSLLLFALPLVAGNDAASVGYISNFAYVNGPSIASNGNHFLTLWNGETFWNQYPHIFGMQSDASDGSNTPAFPVVSDNANISDLSVIGAGSGYAAIWNEPYDGQPFFGRISADGVLQRRVNVEGFVNAHFSPRAVMASNGNRIAIVDNLVGHVDVFITDLDGNMLRRSPIPTDYVASYAVVAMGNDFVVMTAGNTGIIEWLVTNDGIGPDVLRHIQPPPESPRGYSIVAAAKNGRIVIAWTELGSSATLASATIQADGTVTQNSLPTDGSNPNSTLVILPVDSGYVVAWNVSPPAPATPRVFALRLDGNGTPLDAHPSLLFEGQFTGAASSGNTIKFALRNTVSDAVATVTATVDATGIAAQPATPALTPVSQIATGITANDGGFSVAWIEKDSSKNEVRVVAGRMNAAGQPLDGTGIVLDSHASGWPVMAHGASEELIVWNANSQLKAARISSSGGLLDSTPIDIARTSGAPFDVVWNGNRFLVIWIDQYSFSYAFISTDGVATSVKTVGLPFGVVLTDPYMYAGTINVAWDGREYIVVYKEFAPEYADATPTIADIRVLRLSAAGAVLDSAPAKLILGDSDNGDVHVASSGGSESLIVFDRDSGPVSVAVHGGGATLRLDPEVPLPKWQYGMSQVTWNGSAYVVAIRSLLTQPYVTVWLSAIEISRSGTPLRTTFVAMDGLSAYWSAPPAIATDPVAGGALIATEITRQPFVPRARVYLLSEFSATAIPAPPPAPRNAVSYFSGTTARIDWVSDGGASGFVIDWSGNFGATWYTVTTTSADARTVTVNARIGDQFRVRALGPGGLSEGTTTSISSTPRRRAGRP
ncbi:MAG: hypothetical protein WB973_14620, partial [Thermoanaerobaculia bacterium]